MTMIDDERDEWKEYDMQRALAYGLLYETCDQYIQGKHKI